MCVDETRLQGSCVCVMKLFYFVFFQCQTSNETSRERLYRGFPGECQRFVVIVTLVSPILRVLLSWAIVKNFHFFRFSLRVESGEERWAGYYILSKRNISLSSFFRVSFTRHLQSDEGGVNGLCLIFIFSFLLNCSSLFFLRKSTATVIYGRLF